MDNLLTRNVIAVVHSIIPPLTTYDNHLSDSVHGCELMPANPSTSPLTLCRGALNRAKHK